APIGTLPPTGITPGLPPVGGGTCPPGGGTRPPTIGGGTQPPIGTLPPTGVTPGLPSGPQPPGSGGVQPPIGTLPPGGAGPEQGLEARQALGASEDCIDPRSSEANDTDRKDQRPLCSDNAAALQDAASADADPVPITPGRDLIEPTVWNIWSDVNLQDSSDERFGRDNDSLSGSLSFGADRKVDERAVMGLSITFDGSKTEGFDGFFEARSKGVSMGPYAAYRLSEHWAVDGTLTYGVSENELEIVTLEGDYDAQRFTASANLNGQYLVEDLVLRPQVSLYYAYTETKAYDLSGSILGTPVSVRFPSDSYDYATLELSNEFSRTYDVGEGRRVMPYLDIGLLYEFERPNDGKIVGGDLRLRRPSPVSGSVRGGVRAQLADRLLVEGSLGYLSIGQSGLDTFEAGLYLSYGF
ncbi:autotransporter outer membrane beta-barrel domain-containing protein, partial [Limibacillus halophilus]